MRPVLVNHAFTGQRVTGQQRYAAEIASRLTGSPGFSPTVPHGFWGRSARHVWAWVLVVLPWLGRGSALLSLTARAPAWRPRHVVVVHDLFVITHPHWFSRPYVWTHAPLLRAQVRWAAEVVAVSEPVAEQVRRMRSGPVSVAPNAAGEVFRTTPDVEPDAPAELGIVDGSYFLVVGSRDPRKNLARLALAYGLLSPDQRRRHPLVVVGGTASIYRSGDTNWPPGTVEAGYVDDHRLRRLYRGARSVVFVSEAEGFGLPLVEASASGAPSLLVSDIPVFRWICGDHARYVDPLSIWSIAEGLHAEIENPGTEPLDPGRFDWDDSAAVVARVCRRAAGDSTPDSAGSTTAAAEDSRG